jgi:hypothetical protein
LAVLQLQQINARAFSQASTPLPAPISPNALPQVAPNQPVVQPSYLQGQPGVTSNPDGLISPLVNVSPLLLVSPLQLPFRYYYQSGGGDNIAQPQAGLPLAMPLVLADAADTPAPPVAQDVIAAAIDSLNSLGPVDDFLPPGQESAMLIPP